MNEGKLSYALNLFKGLADENRLKIVYLLSERPYNVGELAEKLGLSEPTVSHHLSKLRLTTILNLQAQGNQRFYALNKDQLKRIGQQIASLETFDFSVDMSHPDKSWVNELDLSDEDKKVLRDYVVDGRLRNIPMKKGKLLSIVRWLALQFEPNRFYSEPEVNEIIKQFHHDYAGLRRDMIGFGYMRRERGGSKYWLTPEDEFILLDNED